MIALTFDVEWAPDEVVDECIRLLVEKGLPATLFCTDYRSDRSGNSSNLTGRYPHDIELSIHPNFEHARDFRTVFEDLLEMYPEARGFRSHYLLNSWSTTLLAKELGLGYESNYMLYDVHVEPFKVNREFLDFYNCPIYFMDSPTLTVGGFDWHYRSLPHHGLFACSDTLFVFDFHPQLVFYDLRDQREYEQLKRSYHQVDHASSYRAKQEGGVMRMYRSLIEDLPANAFTSLRSYGQARGLW